MFIERFLQHLQFEKKFSTHTILAYSQDLAQLEEFLQQSALSFQNAHHTHIRSWMVDLLEKGSETRTIHRKISCLRSFYRFLMREQLISTSPLIAIRVPRNPKKLPVFIEEQKMDLLLDGQNIFADNFEGRSHALIVELFYGTGIRLSELVNLQEVDIDLYHQQIKVRGKRNKERIIPINAPLRHLLAQYLRDKQEQHFDIYESALFLTAKGHKTYPQLIYRIVKTYLSFVSTNEKRSPHILRHSFATALLNRGADLNAIKELLGHASLAATQVYTHTSIERLKSIYKQAHPRG